MAVLSDREEATFRITFADENKPALEILMAEFIDEKSAKAKGKRVTTLEVAKIEDVTPEPEPEAEVSPDETEEEPVEIPESRDTGTPEEPETIEVEGVKMTFEKPQDTQLDLF